jgi:hypothetical protein
MFNAYRAPDTSASLWQGRFSCHATHAGLAAAVLVKPFATAYIHDPV